jgi:hypothetical protein
MVDTRTKIEVEMESSLLPFSVPQDQLWVSQMGNHKNRRPDRCPDGQEAKAESASPGPSSLSRLRRGRQGRMGVPVDRKPEPGAASPTTRPRMPAEGTTTVASPKEELGWLDPPMNIEKSHRVWSYSWARPVPAKAAEPNGQILDLVAIRMIDPWGRSGLVLKWRRWKVAYLDVHNQVLPNPNDLYSPEELEKRRLQNWAEEQIADEEARQLRMTQRSQRKMCTLHGVCGCGVPSRTLSRRPSPRREPTRRSVTPVPKMEKVWGIQNPRPGAELPATGPKMWTETTSTSPPSRTRTPQKTSFDRGGRDTEGEEQSHSEVPSFFAGMFM